MCFLQLGQHIGLASPTPQGVRVVANHGAGASRMLWGNSVLRAVLSCSLDTQWFLASYKEPPAQAAEPRGVWQDCRFRDTMHTRQFAATRPQRRTSVLERPQPARCIECHADILPVLSLDSAVYSRGSRGGAKGVQGVQRLWNQP